MTASVPEAQPPARVLLVDDQRLMREGLRTLLELHSDIVVVGEGGDGLEAEHLVEQMRPDVVLMDLRMPREDGVRATHYITQHWPAVQVLVLTTFDDDDLVFSAIEAGAAGYLLKDVGSDALAEAIRSAFRGESPLQPSVARKVLRQLRDRASAPSSFEQVVHETLTSREAQVLRLLGMGATNREIGQQLALTEGTVKNYVSTILAKTGLRDRTQAALYAVRRGPAQELERPSDYEAVVTLPPRAARSFVAEEVAVRLWGRGRELPAARARIDDQGHTRQARRRDLRHYLDPAWRRSLGS